LTLFIRGIDKFTFRQLAINATVTITTTVDTIPEGSAPVRACVEARLAEPSDLVEIQITAYK